MPGAVQDSIAHSIAMLKRTCVCSVKCAFVNNSNDKYTASLTNSSATIQQTFAHTHPSRSRSALAFNKLSTRLEVCSALHKLQKQRPRPKATTLYQHRIPTSTISGEQYFVEPPRQEAEMKYDRRVDGRVIFTPCQIKTYSAKRVAVAVRGLQFTVAEACDEGPVRSCLSLTRQLI